VAAGVLPPLPAAVRERFDGYPEATLRDPRHRTFVVLRLLEEGAGDELRWLADAVGAPALANCVRQHGGRALSRRSRAFWQRVLGVEVTPPPAVARELWPLA
jgi:hypothetical protein